MILAYMAGFIIMVLKKIIFKRDLIFLLLVRSKIQYIFDANFDWMKYILYLFLHQQTFHSIDVFYLYLAMCLNAFVAMQQCSNGSYFDAINRIVNPDLNTTNACEIIDWKKLYFSTFFALHPNVYIHSAKYITTQNNNCCNSVIF